MDDVKVFVARRYIDGAWYSAEIPARDAKEAEKICAHNQWQYDGELIIKVKVPNILTRWLSR